MAQTGPAVWDVGDIDRARTEALKDQPDKRDGGSSGGATVQHVRTLPGAASTTLRDLLSAPAATGRVVGVHRACAYVVIGPDLVAVETADALGLPCSVRLGVDGSARPFAGVRPGDPALVGAGRVVAGGLTVPVVRWWAPRRVRAPRRPEVPGPDVAGLDLAGRTRSLAQLLAGHPCPVPAEETVHDLLGLGPGLTPAGDDLVAGMLVATHGRGELSGRLAAEVCTAAPARTTALSAALLRHAALGMAVAPVLDVADALAGHGTGADLAAAVARLLGVGHSSGTALAHGLLRGARTVAATAEEAA